MMYMTKQMPKKNGGQAPSSALGSLKVAMASEYAKEMADQLLQGKGFFLDPDQLEEIRDNLANVTAMVRLVTKCAWEGREETDFHQDVHAAMRFAMEELEKIDLIIADNTLAECQTLNSDNSWENLS